MARKASRSEEHPPPKPPRKPPRKALKDDEMIEILEDMARNSQNAAARIAAIKQLREMHSGEQRDPNFEKLDEIAEKRSQGRS
jgi:hypothetical protein